MRGSSHFLCCCKESNQRKQLVRLSVHHERFPGVVRKLIRPSHYTTKWSRSSIPQARSACRNGITNKPNKPNQTKRNKPLVVRYAPRPRVARRDLTGAVPIRKTASYPN